MATAKPRITITLEPAQYEVLNRMAKLQGGSMSRIVSELLGEVTPMLGKLCDTLQIATTANAELKARIFKSCEDAEHDLRPIADAVVSQFDLFAACLSAEVGKGQMQPPSSEIGAEADPRPVITGVTNSQRGTNLTKVMQKGESDAL